MNTIRIGDREVARMGLGTNRLRNTSQNRAFIRAAADAGIGLIDTAHLYTGGDSESTIGAAFAGRSAPRPFVATKGGFGRGEGRPDVLGEQIEESLRRLQADEIDLYYLHRVDPDTPLEESVGAISAYRDRGVIRNIGLSEVGIDEIERARRIAPIAAVQNHYNVRDRHWDDVVDHCERESIAFVPFYPLHGPQLPPTQALAWLLHRSPVVLPIPGTLSLDHVVENVTAVHLTLTPDEFAAIAEAA